jgi:hypothetical protein
MFFPADPPTPALEDPLAAEYADKPWIWQPPTGAFWRRPPAEWIVEGPMKVRWRWNGERIAGPGALFVPARYQPAHPHEATITTGTTVQFMDRTLTWTEDHHIAGEIPCDQIRFLLGDNAEVVVSVALSGYPEAVAAAARLRPIRQHGEE